MDYSLRQIALQRISSLETERSSWIDHWREINRVLLPRTGQFFVTDANRGNRRNDDIIDNSATRGIDTCGSGLYSGMGGPSNPWLALETEDIDLMQIKSVSTWLGHATKKMLTIFSRSNSYRVMHGMYKEVTAYGTAVSVVLPDFKDVIRLYPLTVGEYCISSDDRGVVDTLSRSFQMTVAQIVQRFVMKNGKMDWTNVSASIKNQWDCNNLDVWIPVYQLIQPRQDRDSSKINTKNMPFESIIFEQGGNSDKLLNNSGYKRFPVIAPRWETSGQDIYGSSCPGMVALGDILQLQFDQLLKAQGIEYGVKPPLQVPTSLKNSANDFLPGGITYVDMIGQQNAVRTALDVQLDMNGLLLDIQDVRNRINSAFFADLFLFLTSIEGMRGQKTAYEVSQIREEKLQMLGPVVENIEDEMLSPLVDITFDHMLEAGLLPPPPPELNGQQLNPKYLGLLSQAQRAGAMSGVDKMISATASIAAAKQDPSVWDKINTDKVIDKASDYLAVDQEMIRGDDEVAQIRQARAQAQQQAAQAQQIQQAAETANTLAGANMSTDNALTNVINGFTNQ